MDIKTTVKISSDAQKTCDVVGCSFRTTEDVTDGINHYVQSHNYTVLHIGQETTQDYSGNPYQTTVAILGK